MGALSSTQAGTRPVIKAAARSSLRVRADKWMFGLIFLERLVTRFFSNKLTLLPGWANFLDYPVLILFAVYVLAITINRPIPKSRTGFIWPTLALVVVVYASAIINLNRLHPGAVVLFVTDLFEPLAFMFLAWFLQPDQEVVDFLVKIIWGVGFLQIVIVIFMDLPRFLATHNPDFISGTFGTNAYQMVFYLLIWNALILGRSSKRHPNRYAVGVVLLQAFILLIILLAQYRAIIPFAVPTWGLTFLAVSKRTSRAIVGAAAGVAMFLALFFTVNYFFPRLRYGDLLTMASHQQEVLTSGKVHAVENYFSMINGHTRLLFTGTGPGTYASRGFRTFSSAGVGEYANQLYRQLFKTDFYISDVAAKYVMPVLNMTAFGGSDTATPFFSILGFLAEIGLPGLLIVMALYGRAIWISFSIMRQDENRLPLAAWVAIGMILILQIAFIADWLEVSRLTVPLWTAFGVVLAQRRGEEAKW